jgi:anti-sigma B factor antagonist
MNQASVSLTEGNFGTAIRSKENCRVLLKTKSSVADGVATIKASGEIDLATVESLREAMISVLAPDIKTVIFDLDNIDHIDSTGLGVLAGAHRQMASRSGKLIIRCSQPRILRLLQITQLDRVITVESDAGSEKPAAR